MSTTACQINPYLWESDYAEERALALAECQVCPRLVECHAQTETDRAKGLDIIGVSGGVDYTRTKSKRPPITECQNPECARPIETRGTRRKFCDDQCKHRASYRRDSEAAA